MSRARARGLDGQPRLLALLSRLRMSLWLVPGASALFAVGLAHALTEVERTSWLSAEGWYLFRLQPDGARALLSTIATAMLALAGIVFSVTVLVLQLASNQFSPRVLRTFLSDGKTKAAMGTFLGCFVYAIVLLSKVRDARAEAEEFVPALAMFVAYASVLGGVAVFVQYIHHMAQSIRAVNVINRVADETRRGLSRLYPEAALSEPRDAPALPTAAADVLCFNTSRCGVVCSVNDEALLELACQHDLVISLLPRIGDFIPHRAPLAAIWGKAELDLGLVERAVVVEEERTSNQDPAFGFRQLVDIAQRALSPGINDPSTAVQVIDQLHDLLRLLVRRNIPAPARSDGDGNLRLLLPRPDWDDYVHLAFDEIRQCGAGALQVERRLRQAILDLLGVAPAGRAEVLREQDELLKRSVERSFSTSSERRLARVPSAQGQGPS